MARCKMQGGGGISIHAAVGRGVHVGLGVVLCDAVLPVHTVRAPVVVAVRHLGEGLLSHHRGWW